MSYDPNQPTWGYSPGSPPPGDTPPNPGAQSGYDPYAAPPTPPGGAYQPPEGTHPGGYVPPPPPPPGYEGGYAPPPMGQQPYYPAYPGPMAVSTSPWAIASLVSSIASWLLFPIVAAIAGVIFGHMALHEIQQSGGRVNGRGLAIAGLVIGYANLGLALCIGSVIIFGLFLTIPVMR